MHLKAETDSIHWLKQIVYDNYQLDAGEILKNYSKFQKEYKEFKWKSKEKIYSLEAELETVKTERDETLVKMKKQVDDVVTPLIKQVMERQNEITQHKTENIKVQKDLKMLNCVIRSPVLCDLYAKQARKNLEDKQKAKLDTEAYTNLLQMNGFQKNSAIFIKQLADSVTNSLKPSSISKTAENHHYQTQEHTRTNSPLFSEKAPSSSQN